MPEPTIEGPIVGRARIDLSGYDLASLGYVTQEWFLHGSATSYAAGSGLSPDGRWNARPTGSADYVTRIVVVRPIDDDRFDGTVVLEWLNVSSGEDIAAEWLYTHRHLTRSGSVWVGVSAQSAGLTGGGYLRGRHLLKVDPDRYRTLQHPGDAFAFDIFSQAAAAVRRADGPLGGLRATTVLGAGASQSAMYLVTYINAIDPLVQVCDGFLLHGRGVRGAWVQGGLLDPRRFVTDLVRYSRPALPGHRIRSDARVPVMIVQSETDIVLLGSGLARQPDSERVRLWEIAGTSHFDSYGTRVAFRDDGGMTPEVMRHAMRPVRSPHGFHTSAPINCGPQFHYVLQTALEALRRWIVDGTAPASAPRLETRRFQPLRLDRGRDGIVRGGIRTPWVSAPVATLSGFGQTVVGIGLLLGSTRAWSTDELARRYPDGKSHYVDEFEIATRDAIRSGFLLAADQTEIVALGAVCWPADCPADTADADRYRSANLAVGPKELI